RVDFCKVCRYYEEGIGMLNALQPKPPVCPVCKRPGRIDRGQCSCCGAAIHIPDAYFRWLWFLTLLTLAGFAAFVFKSRHIGTWLLFLITVSLPVRIGWSFAIPPWFERGEYKNRWPFAFFYLAAFITLFLEWIAWGWLHVGLGATKSELGENWFFFSIP